MITRRTITRTILMAAAGTSLGSLALSADAPVVADDPLPPLPANLERFAGDAEYKSLQLDPQLLGTAKPSEAEFALARKIMDAAPKAIAPWEVAMFFRNVGQGVCKAGQEECPKEWQPYARAWPKKYNPIIIEFFKATRTDPLAIDGDQTHWCAAFANWCIARGNSRDGKITEAQLKIGSRSASSGSFRCWFPETTSPKKGDLAVWAIRGTVRKCNTGPGHVAFFLEQKSDGSITVVGGNQALSGQSAVTQATYPKVRQTSRGVLEFHSFRSVPPL